MSASSTSRGNDPISLRIKDHHRILYFEQTADVLTGIPKKCKMSFLPFFFLKNTYLYLSASYRQRIKGEKEMIFHLQADFPKQSKWLGQSQEFHPGFPHKLEGLTDLASCAASPDH